MAGTRGMMGWIPGGGEAGTEEITGTKGEMAGNEGGMAGTDGRMARDK